MLPVAAQGAALDTNLVLNSGFENVDLAIIGDYNAPKILDWVGTAFAYSHDGSFSNAGMVPYYADGPDLPGAGHWYFSANNAPPAMDIREPNLFYQDIDVSAGATGDAIATGHAQYDMSAYMSSYGDQADFGNVRVDFKDSAGAILGFALISDSDAGPDNVWSLNSTDALVPLGTDSVASRCMAWQPRATPTGTSTTWISRIISDRDGDGVQDQEDNCSALAMPDQRDTDATASATRATPTSTTIVQSTSAI